MTPVGIIAAHLRLATRCSCGWRTDSVSHHERQADHAEHVVAKLREAGHEIVDRAGIAVEHGVERDTKSGRKVAVTHDRYIAERAAAEWANNARVVQRRVWVGEWEPAATRLTEARDQQ